MSEKSSSNKNNTRDKNTNDYDKSRDKNKTHGDPIKKSDSKRSTSGTGPRDQNK